MTRSAIVIAFAATLLVGCGGDDDRSDDAAAPPSTEQEAPTSTSEAPPTTTALDERSAAIDDFEADVRSDIGLGAGGSAPSAGGDETSATASDTYTSYVTVTDDSGVLSVDVPAEWSSIDGSEGLFGPDVVASTDAQAFLNDFSVPGVEFQATTVNSAGQDAADVLGSLTEGFVSQCTPGQVSPYVDPLYAGVSQIFTDCAGTSTDFVWVAVEPDDDAFTAVVGVQVIDDRDIDALGTILDTFVVRP